MQYWLAKTEPEEYSYEDLENDLVGKWDGVRNPVAVRNLRRMQAGDLVFIYHSGRQKAIVGIAEVVRPAYDDPESNGIAVDLGARQRLAHPVSLAFVKSVPEMASWELPRLPRLSVMAVPEAIWHSIIGASEQA